MTTPAVATKRPRYLNSYCELRKLIRPVACRTPESFREMADNQVVTLEETHARRMHRYAILVVLLTAALLVTGPAVTSNENRPLYDLGQWHPWLGAALTLLVGGLAIGLWRGGYRVRLRQLGWATFAVSLIQGLPYFVGDTVPAPMRILHALLAQLFFAGVVAIAILTATSALRGPAPLNPESASRVRFLATASPAVVLSQVALGAAHRHGAVEAAPHIIWALVTALFLAVALTLILREEHPELQPAGILLAILIAVQMLLGFSVLILQSLDIDPAIQIIATSAHTVTGALTLAATLALAIKVRHLPEAVGESGTALKP